MFGARFLRPIVISRRINEMLNLIKIEEEETIIRKKL